MECPTCTFQNIPGTRTCTRCQTLLDLEAIDFIPPRAARGRTGRRVRAAADSARFTLRNRWRDIGTALKLPDYYGVHWPYVAWSILPGMGQIRHHSMGMRLLGILIAAVWSIMFLLGLLTIGSGFSTLCFFALVSIHCFGITLAFGATLQSQPLVRRLFTGLILYVCVLFGMYWPVSMGLRNILDTIPISNITRQRPIANGDVLVHTSRWTRPKEYKRGDLVVIGINQSGGYGLRVAEGFNVDRIIGLPGETVHTEPGLILINGQPAPAGLEPLGGLQNLPKADLFAGDDGYIVLPSVLQFYMNGNLADRRAIILQNVSSITPDRMIGKVLFRIRPWSRAGRLSTPQAPPAPEGLTP